MITVKDIKNDPAIRTYIQMAADNLAAMGYTEHSFAHVGKVAATAKRILLTLGYPERDAQLAEIAGYLHDIGNIVNRSEHSQSGAIMAFSMLSRLGMDQGEIGYVVNAIGNHDEGTAIATNHISAALIIADKTDVRSSRVQETDKSKFDIHDRVNYSVTYSELHVKPDEGEIRLDITIDTEYCSVMEYFEIFLERMKLCSFAAEKLGQKFRLYINGQTLL